MAYTIREFGHMSWPLSVIGLLIFCCFANLFIPIAGIAWFWLTRKINRTSALSLFLLPITMALSEAYIPTIFPWNFGYTLYWTGLPMFQLGEYIGFQGLSALVIFINWGFLVFWLHRKVPLGKKALQASVLSLVMFNFLGWVTYKNLPDTDSQVNVSIVQANIGNLEKQYAEWGWGFRSEIVKKFFDMTKKSVSESNEKINFVIWPETAYPYQLRPPYNLDTESQRLKNLARQLDTHLLIGAYGSDAETLEVTNSLFKIDRVGDMTERPYSKTILLAFGEYIPFSDRFPILKKWLPTVGHFVPGDGPQIYEIEDYRVGAQICYESLFPYFSVKLARKGAQFIVNVTNDSWYGNWQEPYQHLYMTLARAIELRIPIIRSTNTGISTVVLASGEVLDKSPLSEEWTGNYQVPYISEPKATFYQKYPWLISLILLLLLVSTLILVSRRANIE